MERKIGETFKQKDTTLKCVENESCFGCFYNRKAKDTEDEYYCSDFTYNGGVCDRTMRSDDKSVMFIIKCD